jgi:hypothetical protein
MGRNERICTHSKQSRNQNHTIYALREYAVPKKERKTIPKEEEDWTSGTLGE